MLGDEEGSREVGSKGKVMQKHPDRAGRWIGRAREEEFGGGFGMLISRKYESHFRRIRAKLTYEDIFR